MLEDLRIKDFALIDNVFVEFSNGFTVLSGETGAGKSLLIGALSFLLGGKSGVEQIRIGCQSAQVSGTFYIKGLSKSENINEDDEPKNASQWLSLHGIECEDDRVLLRRIIRDNGKSSAWIGDTPVTRGDLVAFSSYLVDIHGQHEHQSLMRVPEHRKFLDSYAGITDKVSEFTNLYSLLVNKRKILADLETDEKSRSQKIELLNFAVKEISEAKLKKNEDKDLEEEEIKLSSYEKLYSDLDLINSALDNSGNGGAVSIVKKIRGVAQHVANLDKSLESLNDRLESAFYELNDISEEYKNYLSNLVFDPERLNYVQERISLIYNLKKKYASSVNASLDEVFQFYNDAIKRLEELSNGEKNKENLLSDISVLEKKVYAEAKDISTLRKKAAVEMSDSVIKILSELGMKQTVFSVNVVEKIGNALEQKCGPYGMDDIEFLIAANPGNPLQSLAKIASGGELSRVMLALKTVLASSDTIETLVFDEIDTGIGGEIAVSVGAHLRNLAKKCQVLCITHLASIAVYADNQMKIEKSVTSNITNTKVFSITGKQRIEEVARMLSGDSVSQASLDHAESMLLKFGKTGGI